MTRNSRLRILARVLMLAVCAAVISGCSLLRFGYGQLDIYAAWQADSYFELDADQKQEFRKRFDRLHEWHRHEQLPDYVVFLNAIRGRFQKGLAREDVLWVMEGAKERYRAIINRSASDMAAMLLTVTPAQLETLRRKWERDNRRFAREYHLGDSAEEQRQARLRRVISRISDWTGQLSHEQEQKIAAIAADATPFHKLRHADRIRRQREFLQLMTQRGDRATFAERLRRWLLNWEDGRDPEYARRSDEWMRTQADLYVQVARMLTPQQRAHVERRIQNYIDDFTRLAQRPATQAAGGQAGDEVRVTR